MKLILGITGASGSIYAKRIIEIIRANAKLVDELAIVFTETGRKVWQYEIEDLKIEEIPFKIYSNDDYFVAFASGSSTFEAMIVCPCSMGTLAKIANGIADNLITRAADVMLKENRKLVIVPRETPLNLIHVNNMQKAIQAGALICPAMPSFYSKPTTIEQIIDTVIQKVLHLSGIDFTFFEWNKK